MDPQTERPGPSKTSVIRRPLHAYLMAVICLTIGFAIGYFLRASAPPKANPVAVAPAASTAAASVTSEAAAPKTLMLDEMKRRADKQAQPLLTELQKKRTMRLCSTRRLSLSRPLTSSISPQSTSTSHSKPIRRTSLYELTMPHVSTTWVTSKALWRSCRNRSPTIQSMQVRSSILE